MLDQVTLVREPLPLSPLLPQGADDLFRGVTRPEKATLLGVTRRLGTRFFQELMPDEQGRAQCPARITGRRLDPDVIECPVAQQTAIGHAIEPDAACHDEVLHAGLPRTWRPMRRKTSSVTSWMLAARSMCRCSREDSGSRGRPPKSRSNRLPVMVSPWQYVK